MSFDDWFARATGHAPFPYQRALALADALPDQLCVPTGLGKTAAIVLGWAWRRRFSGDATRRATPRRLVFTLPVRTLVEQTRDAARQWFERLGLDIDVYALLGGAVDEGWDEHPERDAVLVGTQDQLLSRALNRGYTMSRFRWPVHFAWLHNDALWVFDEVQLMGVGASTGAQLQGLRRAIGTSRPTHTVWMTATPSPGRLRTVDGVWPLVARGLSDDDLGDPCVRQRLGARKRLVQVPHAAFDEAKWAAHVAEVVREHHVSGTRTLVVLNRVRRAQDVFARLRDHLPCRLLHSRYRASDRRERQREALDDTFAGVLVATQAIEAGVDLTCRTLVTEACPWPSFVQRVGRCNRYGELDEATVVWLDQPSTEAVTAPYAPADVDDARARLTGLDDVGPAALTARGMPDGKPALPVLRRRDLLGLFDTETDLSGVDLDISAFVRDTDDLDVSIAWRDVGDDGPEGPPPQPEELCKVRLQHATQLLRRQRAWRWDSLESRWEVADARLVPGAAVVVACAVGGYSGELGFTGVASDVPAPVSLVPASELDAADADDPLSHPGAFVTLRTHSDDAATAMGALAESLSDAGETPWVELEGAARWHDVGKAHDVFQEVLRAGLPDDDPKRSVLLAKSDGRTRKRPTRAHFRHEVASALAFLAQGATDLQAFVVAAHHGKARLTIRSRPTERALPDGLRPILGVADGDPLPAVDLGAGVVTEPVQLDLSVFALGGGDGPSWMARTQRLLEDTGPFRLAWCEALVRVADWTASRRRVAEGGDL